MWIERKDDRRAADLARPNQEPFDNPCVSAMDAVKVADRHRAAAKIVRQVVEGAQETHGD